MKPLFSIITVTYNAEATIERTLQSVASQTCGLYEHIIVDGASTDDTAKIVDRHKSDRVKWHSSPDKGIYDAMNKGMSMAQGEYYIFLNAGDKFHSNDTLQKYADRITDDDYPAIVYGETILVDNDGHYLGPRHLKAPELLTLKSFRDGMVVCHQAMAVYHKITSLYNLKYRYSADYEWVIRCLQKSKRTVMIPETTIDYLSEGVTTSHHRASLVERFRIMCRYYGTLPTIGRHLGFALRYLKRRGTSANIQ